MKKETEVKVTETVKKAAAPKAEAEKKVAAPKAEAEKKVAAPKAEPKKAAAPKAAKKPAAPRRKAADTVYVQYGAAEWDVAALVEKAKADYVAAGHKATEAKKVTVYVKPEEGKAYYVVNDTDTGSVAL